MSAIATRPLYVYGITSQDHLPEKLSGIQGTPLELIAAGGLAAIVSELPATADPRSQPLGLGREELDAHANVLNAVQQAGPVLPMRFGVVLQDSAEVEQRLIGPYRESLQRQLQYLDGKVELRLRASYEEDTLLREVVQTDPEIAALKRSLAGKPDDATYYERIHLGELVAAAVEQRRQEDASRLLAALQPFVVDVRVSDPPHPRVALQVSLLAEVAKLEEVDQVVEGLGRAHHPRLRLKFTGPLPPYSFVELEQA